MQATNYAINVFLYFAYMQVLMWRHSYLYAVIIWMVLKWHHYLQMEKITNNYAPIMCTSLGSHVTNKHVLSEQIFGLGKNINPNIHNKPIFSANFSTYNKRQDSLPELAMKVHSKRDVNEGTWYNAQLSVFSVVSVIIWLEYKNELCLVNFTCTVTSSAYPHLQLPWQPQIHHIFCNLDKTSLYNQILIFLIS